MSVGPALGRLLRIVNALLAALLGLQEIPALQYPSPVLASEAASPVLMQPAEDRDRDRAVLHSPADPQSTGDRRSVAYLLSKEFAARSLQPSAVTGTISLQGRGSSPNPGRPVPLQVTLSPVGGGSSLPVVIALTNPAGLFQVSAESGTYDVEVKHPQGLSRRAMGIVVTSTPSPPIDFGLLPTGDADNNNQIDILDFSQLRSAFGTGTACGIASTVVVPCADFDGSQQVDIVDFSLLRANYGQLGPLPVSYIPLPPDPSAVAPPLDRTVATNLGTSTSFLYMGANPIQTGVAPGTIEDRRAAVLRGQVLDRANQPLSGVAVKVLDHPEYGQTLSRADGRFDLAVNGGGLLTLDYRKEGFLPAQRQVQAPWQDYAFLPDVVLIPLDPQLTSIDLTANLPMQVARGSQTTDSDGSRRATLLVPQGVTAELILPNGTHQVLTALGVRATEYTVGANGPNAMPAELPPTSAYSYALELSVDQAMAAGAAEVRFSSPLPFYLENFLDLPIGTTAPLGSYDRVRGVWVPAESGRVIKFLSVANGLAELDTNGDGQAESAAALAALEITDAERAQLVSLYAVGQSLWRVQIPHFSPWDVNWPYGPPDDAAAPAADPNRDEPLECQSEEQGSIIGCQNQTLGEALGVVGTPFGLHYQSERVPGRKAAYEVEIPLSGGQVPASLQQIKLEIFVAGQRFTQHFGPAINQRTTFTWDGRDAYGRLLQGSQPVTVRIGYTYGAVYGETANFGSIATLFTTSRARGEITLWRVWGDRIGVWDARGAGLGGWTLSAHHAYDAGDQILYRGDGGRTSAQAVSGSAITTVAGTGASFTVPGPGDGSLATSANLTVLGVATGADGSFYFADGQTIRRVSPSGILSTVAGRASTRYGNACTSGPCGDGGPATQAQLGGPVAVAIGPDNSLYFSESLRLTIRKVDPSGIITTIAGTGTRGFTGDGGPGPLARIGFVFGLSVGPDNSVYLADLENHRIRRIGTDGIISTFAGAGLFNGSTASRGDGGPAPAAHLNTPQGVAVGRDGSVYIAETAGHRVRRVTPDGIIRTIAGTGASGFSGDGGQATQATFRSPSAIALDPDGTVYIVDRDNNRVRGFRPGGTINTVAGSGIAGTTGDGGPAPLARLQNLDRGLAVGPDGSVYVAQHSNNTRIRRIAPVVPSSVPGGLGVPAEDGSELYLFTSTGQHLRTLDALSGALRYQFAYDGAGHLASLTDGDGNVTTIEHDAAGSPTGILGPFGQRTALLANGDGYLTRITSPRGSVVQVTHTTDGLLTRFASPVGHASTYTYDALGRLTSATDPTGATKTLARVGTDTNRTVTLTDALGRATTYRVERLGTGAIQSTTTDPAGGQVQSVRAPSGTHTTTYPDGTLLTVVLGPDPRWGMQAPLVASQTLTTGGKSQVTTSQRTVTLSNPTDPLSLLTMAETTTVNGRIFTNAYAAATRTITQTSPTGRHSTAVLDARGRMIQEQLGDLTPISYTYDTRGRLASAAQGTGADLRAIQVGYGSDGSLANFTDALGRTTSLTRDTDGRVTEQTLPGGRVIRYAYDADGNVTTVAPPGRPDHTLGYTTRDQVSAYTPPGGVGGQTRYTYGADRQPTRTDQPDGVSVAFQYDTAGRLSLVDLPADDLALTYDSASRVRMLNRPGLSIAYDYDGSLPTNTTWSGTVAGSVGRAYDNNFRTVSQSVNNANPIASQYDNDGLLSGIGGLTLTRNAQSGIVTGTTLGGITDTLGYSPRGELTSYDARSSGASMYNVQYVRDLLGRTVRKTETLGVTSTVLDYTYDSADRLIEVKTNGISTATYTYDSNGNRLTGPSATTSYSYDDRDRLLSTTGPTAASYTYTAVGELLTKTRAAQTTTYAYDELGGLVSVQLPTGTLIDYIMDGANRRVGKRVNGTVVQKLLYADGIRPIAELDAANQVISRFVYSTGLNVPAYMIKGGVTYRIITDHLGSPRLVVDAATGAVAQRMDYDEFGRVTNDTNPGFQPFGFAGGLYDRDTQLVRFGARDYDPETGRWTTRDPLGFGGGDSNLYAYVLNDPVNFIDVLGMAPIPAPESPLWTNVIAAIENAGYAPSLAPFVGRYLAQAVGFPQLRLAAATPGGIRALTGRILQRGAASPQVLALLASFAAGYAFGTWLNGTFCLSDRISDYLISVTELDAPSEILLEQMLEESDGFSWDLVSEFTQRRRTLLRTR